MFKWYEVAENLLEQGEIFCLVTITASEGSTPRNKGTIMLVTTRDEYGTIGGGNLEYAAIRTAHEVLKNNDAHVQTLDYILGPDVEQCCGGRVQLTFNKIATRADLPHTHPIKETPLYLFGAGHVGLALANALAPLPFALSLHDNRAEKIAHEVLVYSDPIVAVSAAPKHSMFLIMTHDHSLDYDLISAILKRGDFDFLGLIGSKTKRARFISRLKKDGFTDVQLSRLTCPIGICGLQGKEPEIIAASVVAQLLQNCRSTQKDNP